MVLHECDQNVMPAKPLNPLEDYEPLKELTALYKNVTDSGLQTIQHILDK